MNVTLFLCFCIFAVCSVSGEEMFGDVKQGFFGCDQVTNVTILSNSIDLNTSLPVYLTQFVKSLLETPCVMVWIYSPFQARSIRQQQHNYHNFIATKLLLQRQTFIPFKRLHNEFLSDFLKLNDKNQQTPLVISDSEELPIQLKELICSRERMSLPGALIVLW